MWNIDRDLPANSKPLLLEPNCIAHGVHKIREKFSACLFILLDGKKRFLKQKKIKCAFGKVLKFFFFFS